MHTSFHTANHFTLLFKPVVIDSTTDVVLACVVTCAVTVLYEGLRCLRVNIAQHHKATGKKMHISSKVHALQTVLYLTELLLAYFLMLAAMTYNVWLFLAVPLGALIGFQLCTIFSRSHMVSESQHCSDAKQKSATKVCQDQTRLDSELKCMEKKSCGVEENGVKISNDTSEDPNEIRELLSSV